MTNTQGHKLHVSHEPNKVVKKGSFVTLHYIGKLADGTVFESTNKKPLRILIGEHAVIQGLEEGIISMKVGDKKRIVLAPEKAYGRHHKDLIEEIPLSKIPPEITPAVGMVFTRESKTGRTIFTKVIEVKRDSVVVDMNHPLAGKTLVFDVVVMDVQ